METLFTPMGDIHNNNTETGLNFFINYLNVLEGFKTKTKGLHWAAFAMNIHTELDTLLSTISSFQDSIAEETMGIFSQFSSTILVGNLCDCTDPINMLESLKKKTVLFYTGLKDNVDYVGIKSETETFIHDLNVALYRFKLCRG